MSQEYNVDLRAWSAFVEFLVSLEPTPCPDQRRALAMLANSERSPFSKETCE